ncbi:P-loop containing nucleoside triphosphate hydrolase protein [Lineolata rhizophorae]|uniref:RNA helicase n=1 Tax=Lineolata rhizophorae TaxID=578093 RepID=A0A6A6P5H8_9PEZI|nr:P-loop containing nucleoside triphosphate hydrolase protein [Lineolata rhizophorae]
MPEKVYTRLVGDRDDRTDRIVEPNTNKAPAAQPPHPSKWGVKRKRHEKEDRALRVEETRTSTGTKPKDGTLAGNSAALPSLQRDVTSSSRERLRRNGRATIPDGQAPKRGSLKEKSLSLLSSRKALPIWVYADEIRKQLRGSKDVLLVVGETGSGKSTQVPQFLLDEPWCGGCIAVTQPRRVAAVSLARRVAEEMGTPLGSSSPASKVGYSIRFDTSVSPSTRIKFITEGMLLQEMLRDPTLPQYSAVIVDEVHERSVNVDLILGFLRNIVSKRQAVRGSRSLKVVVMSATADVQGLMEYFDDHPDAAAVGTEAQDHGSSWSGLPASGRSAGQNGEGKSDHLHERLSVCYVKGRQFPVKLHYLSEPTQDFVEEALKRVFQIHYKEPLPGDILVFLTGQDTVEALEALVNEYALGIEADVPKLVTLPLFAALPQAAQQKVFERCPPNSRKVILATNIAETSVTVPGVRFVVDCGKVKLKQFRNRLGLDSLLVKPISQSSAIQRQGRAGRDAPGQCFRLFTEDDYRNLQKRTNPEILRCDLSDALLKIKARGVQNVLEFPFLDKPPRESLENALLQLYHLGALNDDGSISDVGVRISRLPLSPTLGRVILEASSEDKDCLVEIIDIVACLSVENIFLSLATEEKKEEAESARRELMKREGDHLTLLATVQSYSSEQTDRKQWSARHFVSHRAMQNVMDVRKQLRKQCEQLGLCDTGIMLRQSEASEERSAAILRCLLAGFASNTARLLPDGSFKTLLGNQTVAIHPSSVLFGKKVEAIVFSEFVYTNRSYARNVSSVKLSWVDDVLASSS